ncbi:MAG: FMN-dependent NADH-azoreductase [Rhodobacteraceae bacterium]|nr:FMN-dependent NADH-azoreductase [Paracoccaceae bacterium]
MTQTVLRIDASARRQGSVSRDLNDRIVERFENANVITRDLAGGLPLLDDEWIGANFTPEDERTEAQKEKLALSDELIDEVKAADILLIGLPIYNFSVPGALKAWIDLVARAGVTFKYSEYGPQGLLEGKRAIVTVASGGTEVGSDIDFGTGYLKHVLSFIGITDVVFVKADQMMIDADATLKSAHAEVDALDLAA